MAHLVQLSSLFGINENRARVALSRMVASGEVTTDGAGRTGCPVISSNGNGDRTPAGPGAPVAGGATGMWWWSPPRAARPRFGTTAATPWSSPACPSCARGSGSGLTISTRASPGSGAGHHPVVGPPGPARRAGRSAVGHGRRGQSGPGTWRPAERPPPRDWTDLAPGFVLSASVLRHFQADPLLPPELLAPTGPARTCAPSTTTGTLATVRSWPSGPRPPDRIGSRSVGPKVRTSGSRDGRPATPRRRPCR